MERISTICHASNVCLADNAKITFRDEEISNPSIEYFPRGYKLKKYDYAALIIDMTLDDYDCSEMPEVELNQAGDQLPAAESSIRLADVHARVGETPQPTSTLMLLQQGEWVKINGDINPNLMQDRRIVRGIRDLPTILVKPQDVTPELDLDAEQNYAPFNQIWGVYICEAKGSTTGTGLEDGEDRINVMKGRQNISVSAFNCLYFLRELYSKPLPTDRAGLAAAQTIANCVRLSAITILSSLSRIGICHQSGLPVVFRSWVSLNTVGPLNMYVTGIKAEHKKQFSNKFPETLEEQVLESALQQLESPETCALMATHDYVLAAVYLADVMLEGINSRLLE